MTPREALLDLEAQVAAHNAAQRAEHTAAAPDPLDYRWIGGVAYDPIDVPDARDVAEMERWG